MEGLGGVVHSWTLCLDGQDRLSQYPGQWLATRLPSDEASGVGLLLESQHDNLIPLSKNVRLAN